ncbi:MULTISPECIES: hypothetical protein [unclassified Campylobacter]|nr:MULTISPECIES: hypothetical protein [unclassified Campylobacter]KAA6228581.1 hypothetical protein FMM55_00760 [Campylobacter sp. LR196d]KAA6229134.1 hypothetical protein FMM57_01045 [Campylobacter sp. LR286c]KAA6233925.1 hypothetical protein FMM58_01175 [Campylobacter sp. LR291e]KAA6234164.1 hypothetical protein FMM56_01100 [Campylobacter sp. LR264d]
MPNYLLKHKHKFSQHFYVIAMRPKHYVLNIGVAFRGGDGDSGELRTFNPINKHFVYSEISSIAQENEEIKREYEESFEED